MVLLRNARITDYENKVVDIQCDTHIQSIHQVADGLDKFNGHMRPVHIGQEDGQVVINCNGNVVLPAMCHPHVHLDKCFLLDHCDANLKTGDFQEALYVTSEAKQYFTHEDLVARGERLLQSSVRLGVTSARCHVEVDLTVELMCLEAAIELKTRFSSICDVQIAVFAQDPIFSGADKGHAMRQLFAEAAKRDEVDAIGSAPYVECSDENAMHNVRFITDLAVEHGLFLDFHMDYDLDSSTPALIFDVLDYIESVWSSRRPITFGHVTKLTVLKDEQIRDLQTKITKVKAPIHFIGLPTSDMHMMGRQDRQRPRGTLQCIDMIQDWDLNSAVSINNCGNSFTPMVSKARDTSPCETHMACADWLISN